MPEKYYPDEILTGEATITKTLHSASISILI
jgi:hypothetical protein